MRMMKDSGIEWIGDAPQNWQLVRIKVCISRRDSGAWGEEATGEPGDYVCIRVADMDYDRLRLKDDLPFTYRNYEEKVIESLKLADGDILIEKSGGGEKTLVGRAVMFRGTLQAVFANFMERIRCRDFVRSRFLMYILAVLYQSGYIKNYIKQTTGIQNLDISSMFSKVYLALPPITVQDRITDYLDRKCSQIDAIIAQQQEVIEKLKAYKLSVITEAVTKGLNPDAPMKDSGVEWIGKIPEHWQVPKIKYLATIASGGTPDRSHPEYWNGSINWAKTGELQNNELYETEEKITEMALENSSAKVFSVDTILVAMYGQGKTRGMTALLKVPSATNQACAGITVYSKDITVSYLWLFLMGAYDAIREKANGSGQPNLSGVLIADFNVTLPPIEEQMNICKTVAMRLPHIDSIIKQKETIVDKLTAYKKSLIYEVVTGKKEV